jgi:hypothetical protein
MKTLTKVLIASSIALSSTVFAADYQSLTNVRDMGRNLEYSIKDLNSWVPLTDLRNRDVQEAILYPFTESDDRAVREFASSTAVYSATKDQIREAVCMMYRHWNNQQQSNGCSSRKSQASNKTVEPQPFYYGFTAKDNLMNSKVDKRNNLAVDVWTAAGSSHADTSIIFPMHRLGMFRNANNNSDDLLMSNYVNIYRNVDGTDVSSSSPNVPLWILLPTQAELQKQPSASAAASYAIREAQVLKMF